MNEKLGGEELLSLMELVKERIRVIRLKGGGEIKDASWKEACKAFCVEIHRLRAEDKAEQEAKELMSRSRNRAKCEREHHPIRLPLC